MRLWYRNILYKGGYEPGGGTGSPLFEVILTLSRKRNNQVFNYTYYATTMILRKRSSRNKTGLLFSVFAPQLEWFRLYEIRSRGESKNSESITKTFSGIMVGGGAKKFKPVVRGSYVMKKIWENFQENLKEFWGKCNRIMRKIWENFE